MRKKTISTAFTIGLLFLLASTTFAIEKKQAEQTPSLEQIATFSGCTRVHKGYSADRDVEKKFREFLKKYPHITIIDRKMSIAGPTDGTAVYCIAITIFYRTP